MILVDTSVWADHWRAANTRLSDLLIDGQILTHPFVIGELACGQFRQRAEVLTLMNNLGQTPPVTHDEALAFIDSHRLMGTGLGWIDVHLLASAALTRTQLWTRDNRLLRAARRLGIGYAP